MAKMMKKESDGAHPSSHYLVVENSKEVSTWHLRVRDVGGKVDHTLMGAAWAALHGGYRGNKYEGPQKTEALAKLKKLYQSEGMPMPGMKSIWYKDASDALWFIGVYSNNFEDRHEEIISQEAHDEFVSWLKEKGIKPPIVFLHQPNYPDELHAIHYLGLVTGRITPDEFNANLLQLYEKTAIAQTQTVFTMNGFTFVVAKVFDHQRALAEKLMKRQDSWGMSHGFIVINKDDNIISRYRSFEFSLLPESLVANQLTPILLKGTTMEDLTELKGVLNDEDRALLNEVLGDQSEKTLDEKTKVMKDIFSRVLNSKAMHDDEEEDDDEDKKKKDDEEMMMDKSYESLRSQIFADFKLQELMDVLKGMGEKLSSQEELITALQTQIKTLEKTKDEVIAEAFEAPAWMSMGLQQKQRTDEQELIQKLKENVPPPPVDNKGFDPKNPIDVGVWHALGFK